jgi:hypothetical protein
MSLATIMLDQLAVARRIIEDGQEVVPAWRVETPEGAFLILARLDANKPDQREHTMVLISRFMAWKMATSFVLTAETWVGAEGEDALLVIGVSHHERLAVVQRIRRGENVSFSKSMWLAPHHVDDRFAAVLPQGSTAITSEEAAALARIFGKNGELAATRVSS